MNKKVIVGICIGVFAIIVGIFAVFWPNIRDTINEKWNNFDKDVGNPKTEYIITNFDL